MTTPASASTLSETQTLKQRPLTAPIPPLLQSYLDNLNHVLKPYFIAQGFTATPINAREALAMLTFTYVTQAPNMAKTLDTYSLTPQPLKGGRQAYNVPLRVFVPEGMALPNIENPPDVPVMIYFHGGGGMAGSVSIYDKIYKKLAHASGCLVIAPEYRLAPENLYPAGIDDAHNVLHNLTPMLTHIGYRCDGQCVIAGDSAGGAITATLVQDWLAGKVTSEIAITKQILIYASLDYTLTPPPHAKNSEKYQHASLSENATGYLLETPKIHWYFDNYFTLYDDRELASPYWTDLQRLAHNTTLPLPATLNITTGYCPLRDEDIGYHEQLLQSGFNSEWLHFADMVHTFINLENLCLEACQTFYQKVGEFVKE